MTMKSLQEWAADCIAKSLLHSLCVTQLATSAFRCQVDSSQRETIAQCLVSPQELYALMYCLNLIILPPTTVVSSIPASSH